MLILRKNSQILILQKKQSCINFVANFIAYFLKKRLFAICLQGGPLAHYTAIFICNHQHYLALKAFPSALILNANITVNKVVYQREDSFNISRRSTGLESYSMMTLCLSLMG